MTPAPAGAGGAGSPLPPEAGLLSRIESRQARVGVSGLGYVGLPLAVAFAEAGFPTLGLDVDPDVVERVGAGRSHILDVPPSRLAPLIASRHLEATTDASRLAGLDAILVCVPTPLGKTGDPDVSFILRAADAVAAHLRRGQLVVLESTTYPGTTREVLQERLERTGLAAGRDFFVAFSPERVNPGDPVWRIENTPKVVGGLTPRCHRLAVALYGAVVERVVEVSSPEAAELTKILENTFRAVNIGLVNEMAVIADRLGIDVWEVIEAASTKPYGFMRFVPGPGLGGHCIPVDPIYLSWKMKSLRYRTRFIELAAEVNAEMPRHVVARVAAALNRARRPLNGSRILVLGVAYKPGVPDLRESPVLDVLQLLSEAGAELAYHDPFVPRLAIEGLELASVALDAGRLEASHAVIVATDHPEVDYDLVARHAGIVVDPRNAMRGRRGRALVYPIAGPARALEPPAPGEPDAEGGGAERVETATAPVASEGPAAPARSAPTRARD